MIIWLQFEIDCFNNLSFAIWLLFDYDLILVINDTNYYVINDCKIVNDILFDYNNQWYWLSFDFFELLFDTLIFENALERELGKKIISFFQ